MQKHREIFKILVVEDNAGDLALIEDYLREQIAYPNIHHAKNYQEASAQLDNDEADFDVTLLDLTLPDKSGTELITNILTLSPDHPVVVLTGHSDSSFAIRSLALGVSDYLLKDEMTPSSLYKSIVYSIERKKTLRTLEDSEKKYSDLFHLGPQPLWVFDLETLKFLFVNNAAINKYGYSKQEFFSMTILDIRREEERSEFEAYIRASIQRGDGRPQGIFKHRKKSGEIMFAELQSNTIQFDGKKATLVLAHDITERFEHIEAIEKQNEKLREIAWIQSHIVRAPLARAMGIAALIKELKNESPECSNLLGFLLESCTELDLIIRDIAQKASLVNGKA